jgi:hypothetical protein
MADHPDLSKHVWRPNDTKDKGARAIDCDDPLRAWLRRYGRPYGWTFPIKPEKWHAEYDSALDTKRSNTMSWTDTTGTTNPITGKPVTKAEALQIAQHYAFRAWQLGIEARTQTAALSAAVTALTEDPEIDADALAMDVSAALAPMLTDTIVDAIAAAGVLTPEQARDAAEAAIREVLGSLAPGA